MSSDLCDGLTSEGIPQLSLDQMNPRHFFHANLDHTISPRIFKTWDGGVLQYVAHTTKLTRGFLMKQSDWGDWQQAEYLQLDQYDLQHMFGDPAVVSDNSSVFNLVWTNAIMMAPRAGDRSEFSILHMLTARTTRAPEYSTPSPQVRIFSCSGQM